MVGNHASFAPGGGVESLGLCNPKWAEIVLWEILSLSLVDGRNLVGKVSTIPNPKFKIPDFYGWIDADFLTNL
ncbi:hypothetical protein HCG51_12430 [Tolypothrix sp. PCC 7910]|uniref:hypothetical protein n=1 Tax=Tolypothrix sp. PCC 7910 TaxID=2099387 RepID=UPI00142773B6|nr:hypothetical protein [Tolypothrix sp. PCC 7910]QIR37437.1 hypothetical protein HCG51_12430 [Tolypothrix sp. PCC 7910]